MNNTILFETFRRVNGLDSRFNGLVTQEQLDAAIAAIPETELPAIIASETLLSEQNFSLRADGASYATIDAGSDMTPMTQKTASFAASPLYGSVKNGQFYSEVPYVPAIPGNNLSANLAIVYLGKTFSPYKPNRFVAEVIWRDISSANNSPGAVVVSFGSAHPSNPNSWVSGSSVHIRIYREGLCAIDTFSRVNGVLTYKTLASTTIGSTPWVEFGVPHNIEIVKTGNAVRITRDGINALTFEHPSIDLLWGATCFFEMYSPQAPFSWPGYKRVRWYSEVEPVIVPANLSNLYSLDLIAGVVHTTQSNTADGTAPAYVYGVNPGGNTLFGANWNPPTVGRIVSGYYTSTPSWNGSAVAHWFDRHPQTTKCAQFDVKMRWREEAFGANAGDLIVYFATTGATYIHNSLFVTLRKVGVIIGKFTNGVYAAIASYGYPTAIPVATDVLISLQREGTTLRIYVDGLLRISHTDAAIDAQWGKDVIISSYAGGAMNSWPEVAEVFMWSKLQTTSTVETEIKDYSKVTSLDLLAGVDFSTKSNQPEVYISPYEFGISPGPMAMYGLGFYQAKHGYVNNGWFTTALPYDGTGSNESSVFLRKTFSSPSHYGTLQFKFTATGLAGTDSNGVFAIYFATAGSTFISNCISIRVEKTSIVVAKYVDGTLSTILGQAFASAWANDSLHTIEYHKVGQVLTIEVDNVLFMTVDDAAISTQWGNDILWALYSNNIPVEWPSVKSLMFWKEKPSLTYKGTVYYDGADWVATGDFSNPVWAAGFMTVTHAAVGASAVRVIGATAEATPVLVGASSTLTTTVIKWMEVGEQVLVEGVTLGAAVIITT